MRIAICDDEILYAKEIESNVQAFLREQQINTNFDLFIDSSKLYNSPKAYDIVFLDIEMSPYNGIETAERLKETNPNIIIFFITSYEKYLDEAMDLNAFRYIKKPLDVKRLRTCIEKALMLIDESQINFFIKNGKEAVSISSNSIIYIEIIDRSTKVVLRDNTYLSCNSMDFWSEKLIASFFYKVHKSFIINMKFITNYKRSSVILCNKYEIPIAYRKQAAFRSYFLNYFGGR